MVNSISSDLIRGHINTIILRSLYDGDKYGYEICKEIEEKSHGQYELKQPTLYSSLKRLETQGYVTAYWGSISGGGRRRYFKLTELGRSVAEQNLAEWEYSRTVIDKLISEKDFDLTAPAPSSSVNFQILKDATTKPPRPDTAADVEEKDEQVVRPVPAAATTALCEQPAALEPDYKNILSRLLPREEVEAQSEPLAEVQQKAQAEFVAQTGYTVPSEPYVQPVFTETVEHDEYIEQRPHGQLDFSDIIESAARDGLKIRTSHAKSAFQREDQYVFINWLRCLVSLIVFATMLVELCVFAAVFYKTIGVKLSVYLYIAAAMTAVPLFFTVVYFLNPSRSQRNRFHKKRSLATAFIIMLNCFLAVAVFALLFNANLTKTSHLLMYILFPIIVFTNIPLSVLVYSGLLNTKRFHAKPIQ